MHTKAIKIGTDSFALVSRKQKILLNDSANTAVALNFHPFVELSFIRELLGLQLLLN